MTRVQGKKKTVLATRPRAARRSTSARAARPNYARPRRAGGAHDRRRQQGLRRPARRRLPRRPRQRLRPRGAAAVQHRAPDLDAEHGRRQLGAGVQRAHDRDPGADQGPDQGRRCRQRPVRRQGRRSASGPRRAGASRRSGTPARASTSATGPGSRSPGSATRWSTRCSSRWPRRTCGTPGRRASDARFAKYVDQPELAGLLPALYPGVFPNLAAYAQVAGRPQRDPADRHPGRRRARVPELHRTVPRRTCSG